MIFKPFRLRVFANFLLQQKTFPWGKTCFNEFCEDIKRTLRFYMKNNSHAFFNNFYITGGSSNIPGINEFIASALNVKVSTFDPLQKISNDIQIDNPNQYSSVIGLALRGLDIE